MTPVKQHAGEKWAGWLLVLILGTAVLLIQPWEQGRAAANVSRRPLAEFPAQAGEWQRAGMDQRFDAASEKVLNANDYVLRNYRSPAGAVGSLFVGYYENLEFSSNWHSPTVCLPGTGWELKQQVDTQIPGTGATPDFTANTFLIQKGSERLVMLYWFQGRGRFTTGDFWNKLYSTLDGLRHRRADGAIVRVLVPVDKTPEEAVAAAKSLAAQVAPTLAPYVPN